MAPLVRDLLNLRLRRVAVHTVASDNGVDENYLVGGGGGGGKYRKPTKI